MELKTIRLQIIDGLRYMKNAYKYISKYVYETVHETGLLEQKGSYEDDFEIYDDNRHLRGKFTYKDGKLDGPYEIYDNGQLREKGTYKHGLKKGPYEKYHDNGQLAEKGTENRKLYVPFKKYDEKGKFMGKYIRQHDEFANIIETEYKDAEKEVSSKKNTVERKGLSAVLAELEKQMEPTQLRQNIKRAVVAEYRKKHPKGGRS